METIKLKHLAALDIAEASDMLAREKLPVKFAYALARTMTSVAPLRQAINQAQYDAAPEFVAFVKARDAEAEGSPERAAVIAEYADAIEAENQRR